MNTESNFVELRDTSKIWAIGSIHSNIDSFNGIKDFILNNFEENDKLIFLGNIIGLGKSSKESLTSVLDLRFKLMSKFRLKNLTQLFF